MIWFLCFSMRRISSNQKLYLWYCDDYCQGVNFYNTKIGSWTDTYCFAGTASFSNNDAYEAAIEKCSIDITIPTAIPPQTLPPMPTAISPETPLTPEPPQTP